MIQKLSPIDYAVSAWSGGTTTQLAIWPPEAKYADRNFLWRISSATVDLEESDFTPLPDYDRLIATLEGDIVLTHNGGEPIPLRPLEVHAFSGADVTRSRGRCRDFNLMLRRDRVTGTMEALRLTENPVRIGPVCSAGNLPADPAPPICSAGNLPADPAPPVCSAGNLPADPAPPVCSAGNLPANPVPPICSAGNLPADPAPPVCSAGNLPADPAYVLLYCVEGKATAFPNCHSERGEAESKNPFPPSPTITFAPGEALLLTAPAALTLTGPGVLMVCRMTPAS